MKKNDAIDCIKMTRDIRDSFYKENNGKSLKEIAYTLANDAKKSRLWKKARIMQISK